MRRMHDAPCTLQMEWAPYKCSDADTLWTHKLMSVEHDIIHSGYSTGFDEHQYFEYPDYGYDPLMVSSTPQKAVMSVQSMPMKQEFEEQILDRISSPLYDDLYGSTASLSLAPQQQGSIIINSPSIISTISILKTDTTRISKRPTLLISPRATTAGALIYHRQHILPPTPRSSPSLKSRGCRLPEQLPQYRCSSLHSQLRSRRTRRSSLPRSSR